MDATHPAHEHGAAMPHTTSRIGFWDACRKAWRIFAERWETVALLTIASVLLSGLIAFIGFASLAQNMLATLEGATANFGVAFAVFVVAMLIAYAVSLALQVGILHTLAAPDPQAMRFGAAFKKGFRTFFPFFLLTLLSSLVMFGGFMLLIVPGIIWSVSFIILPWLFIEEGTYGMPALVKARRLVKGEGWWVFFMSLGAVLPILILSLLPQLYLQAIGAGDAATAVLPPGFFLFLGLSLLLSAFIAFVAGPWYQCFILTMYRDLRARKEQHLPEVKRQPMWFWVALVIAIVGLITGGVMLDRIMDKVLPALQEVHALRGSDLDSEYPAGLNLEDLEFPEGFEEDFRLPSTLAP